MRKDSTYGQAATELAVFGAILIFLIGGIVRSALSAGYQQNQQLKSMRQALLTSYDSTRGGLIAHNLASVLYIEDRLSPDMNKYGPTERMPFITAGGGSMSNMLMYPVDLKDLQDKRNIPVMDVYINNQHFEFTTAQLVPKTFNPPPGYDASYAAPPDPRGDGTHRFGGWDFRCVHANGVWYGCPIFYQVKARVDPSSGPSDFCTADPCSSGLLTAAERFDLNRDDKFDNDPQATPTEGKPGRGDMSWQWTGVKAVAGAVSIDKVNGSYPFYDVDNDRQEETIYNVVPDGNGIITRATVLDFQDGDIDLTHDNTSPGPRAGLQNDMFIFTGTGQGTYLQIKEGKLYNPETGAFVRSASKKDQVELVQRMFQLSRNSDSTHFCSGDQGVPPVEVCSDDCFSGDNIKQTCFDKQGKMLYVRSRILGKTGHFWRTDVSGKLP